MPSFMPYCLTCLQAGEDKISYERHIKQLQIEFAKTRRNPQVVAELMKKTYSLRRAEILEQTSDLTKVLEKFPFLQEIDHVSTCSAIICAHCFMPSILFVACPGVANDFR